MILALPQDVRERLDHIERTEGVPPLEVCHQAISVFSQLDAGERRALGVTAIGLVMERHYKGGRV
ncbi:hypothetical protein [Aureimonas sp. AU4]|uniref:hypothetical protein n=1 Tax=Aureimonas sp. AU4 TaxID=1638163 RepID=UPI000785A003|nr:hypothetical protein [Aureimonas sp. AU4]